MLGEFPIRARPPAEMEMAHGLFPACGLEQSRPALPATLIGLSKRSRPRTHASCLLPCHGAYGTGTHTHTHTLLSRIITDVFKNRNTRFGSR